MDFDRKLFKDFEKGLVGPTFRIYGWNKPCISIGYSQKIKDLPKRDGWEIVKRPTGGGICFHETSEISYSVVAAKDDSFIGGTLMESYFRISEIILKALKNLGVNARIGLGSRLSALSSNLCFEQIREYEITLNGKKIVGSAQRRGKRGFLQQGTILVGQLNIERAIFVKILQKQFKIF